MTPYGNSLFFYILALVSIPAVILGLMQVRLKIYGLIATIIMLLVIYSGSKQQVEFLIAFYGFELFLIKGYSLMRPKLGQGRIASVFVWLMVFLSIAPLIFCKYGKVIAGFEFGLLGISYLTFKAVQMVIEVHDGLIKEIGILDFTYFLLFFPTISSGPIDRSRRFAKDLKSVIPRPEYVRLLGEGIWKLMLGIGYYFIAAYLISNYWLEKIPHTHNLFDTINYMYSYSMYLFFDFAGYSMMAVGTSYIFGVRTPHNFNAPFISKDIKEFWNRWHMSLSFWFRDFIYTRFVMAALKRKWFASKFTASYTGYFITMGIMGIWHGTEIYYLIYGAYHGLLIVLTDFFQRKSSMYKKYKNKWLWKAASTFVTFNLICFGLLIFSGFLFKK